MCAFSTKVMNNNSQVPSPKWCDIIEGAHRQYCNINNTTEEILSQSFHVEEMGEFCLYKLNRCSKTIRKEQKISYKVKHLVM